MFCVLCIFVLTFLHKYQQMHCTPSSGGKHRYIICLHYHALQYTDHTHKLHVTIFTHSVSSSFTGVSNFDIFCTVHVNSMQTMQSFPTYSAQFSFYLLSTRFGLTRGHRQEMFSADCCLPSGRHLEGSSQH